MAKETPTAKNSGSENKPDLSKNLKTISFEKALELAKSGKNVAPLSNVNKESGKVVNFITLHKSSGGSGKQWLVNESPISQNINTFAPNQAHLFEEWVEVTDDMIQDK